jgi:hypothetical protein
LPESYLFSERGIIPQEEEMEKTRLWAMVIAASLLLAFSGACASGQEAPRVDQATPRVDKETLKSWLADPQVVILDVRQPKDWQGSDKKIKGAVRQDPKEVYIWAASLPKEKKIVLYCS